MNSFIHTRVLIVGSGPAGYTAAIYAERAALEPVLVRGLQPGGQLMITTDVENWPGDTAVMGPDLMARMEAQCAHLGVRFVDDIVTSVRLDGPPFVAEGDTGATYAGDTLIIATGAQARWLGLPSETRLRGAGVSACATCDGFFFRGKTVAVVGGGNSAVEEALFLTNFASKVYLIHRREGLRADKVNQARLFSNPKVEPIWNAAVSEVLADGQPATVAALRLETAGGERILPVDGLFVAIGHDPATAMFRGQLAMDDDGYIAVNPGTAATSVPGVFACGDVMDKHYRQAITAAGTGCMAALEAERWLAAHSAHAIAAEEAVPA